MKIYCSRENKRDLDKFIGEDIWVKIYEPDKYYDTSIYVKIIKAYRDGEVVQYKYSWLPGNIDSSYVRSYKKSSVIYLLDSEEVGPLDRYVIKDPLELLTTEEVNSIIEDMQ